MHCCGPRPSPAIAATAGSSDALTTITVSTTTISTTTISTITISNSTSDVVIVTTANALFITSMTTGSGFGHLTAQSLVAAVTFTTISWLHRLLLR